MASYQQRIPLKGTEESIDYFTNILRATKNAVGVNSAEVLLKALAFWHNDNRTLLNRHRCSAFERNNIGQVSRLFYLQVLTTPEIMQQINTHLDRVRRGYALKSLLDTHEVGRAEFLLEALIFILECFKEFSNAHLSCSTTDGIRSIEKVVNSPFKRTTNNVESKNLRQSSVEPSLSFTPARLGSVGRDEGFEFPSRNWRSRLREQQLADNRRLLDSVKSNRGRITTSEMKNNVNNNHYHYGTANNLQTHENRAFNWLPVHELAINKHAKTDNEAVRRQTRLDGNNNPVIKSSGQHLPPHHLEDSLSRKLIRRELSEPPQIVKTTKFEAVEAKQQPPSREVMMSNVRERYDKLEKSNAPILSLKERKSLGETLCTYLSVQPPELRETPGYDDKLTNHDRIREGIDCDEVFPQIVLGNGATVKKKAYLKKIGITHVLNAAEYRGVNVGQDYFNQLGDNFQYLGVRIEDTPQTQICRHFCDVVEFMDEAILQNGKIFVNCVFGKSRSTTFVVAYMMLCHNWQALDALRHIRAKRNVQLNPGFLLQLIDLDYKLKWSRMN